MVATTYKILRHPSGHFNWTCANLVIAEGDSYSTAGGKAFESAAIASQIDVCTKVSFQSASTNVKPVIKEIMDNRCCLVTVVFGKTQDLASLLLEAHKQNYDGEWVMGDNIKGSLDTVVNDLKKNLEPSSVHELLTGMFDLILKEVSRCFSEYGTLARNHNGNTILCSMPLTLSHRVACLHVNPHFMSPIFRDIHVRNQTSKKRPVPRF